MELTEPPPGDVADPLPVRRVTIERKALIVADKMQVHQFVRGQREERAMTGSKIDCGVGVQLLVRKKSAAFDTGDG